MPTERASDEEESTSTKRAREDKQITIGERAKLESS